MDRRTFIQLGAIVPLATTLEAKCVEDRFSATLKVIADAVERGTVASASVSLQVGDEQIQKAYGKATVESPFLLGSISKPICVVPLMRLLSEGALQLEDLACRYLPEFQGDGRERVQILHLLTHVSGLPDQLPDNAQLRKTHAGLEDFVKHALRLPLSFEAGVRYQYSSMGILLATEVARRLTSKSILHMTQEYVFDPLGMKHSALGLGALQMEELIPVQTEHAAPEAGGGDPTARDWDWNSPYWRRLGAPWGGVHASASDVHTFLRAFYRSEKEFLTKPVRDRMIQNQLPKGLMPRGVGFGIGASSLVEGVTETTVGHTGSTGTLAWFDAKRDASLVVLTSLPGEAVRPHPRAIASRTFTDSLS